MVMGVVLSVFIPFVGTMRFCSSLHNDKQKYDRICYAIAAYVIRTSHLPAPAKELASGEISSNENDVGFVPFKSIGLSKDFSINSSGKPIKYAPNRTLVAADSIHKPVGSTGAKSSLGTGSCEFCGRFEAGSLKLDVIDAQGQSVTDKSTSSSVNPMAFVLFAEDESIQVTISDIVIIRIQGKSSSVRYVFRDDLMSYYARYPCPPAL
jgi:hypothetical protein